MNDFEKAFNEWLKGECSTADGHYEFPSYIECARWARAWCDQKNLAKQMKDINYKVLQSNKECIDKLRTENQRLAKENEELRKQLESK